MKFELSDDQALLRSSTRDFLSSEFSLEKSRNVMEHSKAGYDPAEWRRLAERKLPNTRIPLQHSAAEKVAKKIMILNQV
jgi:alkylation response protein AidB-like acyl-CoA dehydrogenase